MANAMMDAMNQRVEAQNQKTKSQQKGKGLPPSLSQLSPEDLKHFIGVSLIKFMRQRLNPKNVESKNLYKKASLSDHIEALKDSMSGEGTIQNYGRRSH